MRITINATKYLTKQATAYDIAITTPATTKHFEMLFITSFQTSNLVVSIIPTFRIFPLFLTLM